MRSTSMRPSSPRLASLITGLLTGLSLCLAGGCSSGNSGPSGNSGANDTVQASPDTVDQPDVVENDTHSPDTSLPDSSLPDTSLPDSSGSDASDTATDSGESDTLLADGCVPACPEAGAVACDGNARLVCVFNNGCLEWDTPVSCDDGDPCTTDSCAAGVCDNPPIVGCTSECDSGETRCKPGSATILQTCPDGLSWVDTPCDGACLDGSCQQTACIPNERVCVDQALHQCTADGSGTELIETCDIDCVTPENGETPACAVCETGASSCESATTALVCMDPLEAPVSQSCSSIDTCALGACTGTITWTDGDGPDDSLWWLTVHVGECHAMAQADALGAEGLCWVLDTTWMPVEVTAAGLRTWACDGIASGDLDDDELLGALAGVEAVMTCDAAGGAFTVAGGGTITTGTALGDWCMIGGLPGGTGTDGVGVVPCNSLTGWL